ncbi:LOW QUALITY PROTEIN: zinc finger BED domain-containing protein 5-like [Rhinoraja longicauda]
MTKRSFDHICLSNKTVHRRITKIVENIKQILLSNIRQNHYYALQVDESTDIANFANLLVFVTYEKDKKLHDDLLFCQPFPEHTTGEEIFNIMDEFMQQNKLDWKRCVGISTDGGKAMVGCKKGLVSRIKTIAPDAKSTHCCIHREALATHMMSADLKKVLDEAVKIIGYIKGCPLNARLFSQRCEEVGSNHTFFHTAVRLVSRGKVLTRLFEFRNELLVFLNESFELKECLEDWRWLLQLAYLADIFSVLNNLNLSSQGKEISIFSIQDKVSATVAKFKLWQKRVVNGKVDSFPSLHELQTSSSEQIEDGVMIIITQH